MSFQKSVIVVCDDCLDAAVEVLGGSQDKCWQKALELGWKSFPPPKAQPWRPRTQVCVRCLEYGRPYKDTGVPNWRGLGVSA